MKRVKHYVLFNYFIRNHQDIYGLGSAPVLELNRVDFFVAAVFCSLDEPASCGKTGTRNSVSQVLAIPHSILLLPFL